MVLIHQNPKYLQVYKHEVSFEAGTRLSVSPQDFSKKPFTFPSYTLLGKSHQILFIFLLWSNKSPQLKQLKTAHLLAHSLWGSGDWTQLTWVLCLGAHKLPSSGQPGCILMGRLDCGRICFPAYLGWWQNSVVELQALVSCWLLVEIALSS